ncbi:DUF333 domain-containing protein [Budviciaceae bacterium CWB-B4]|uniref:DUF333 domain-containing protein n=2 Tax=Limnobaculum xujianqingii TaxID=2738837 RepID=A0A9D7AI10_9GAMM|nr:DUF333 domain-containing protein [Limnobaculum xujianqingii]MBK5073099.1 DUF333 domain-containing protein [Limnobaculum xujianqingii]MBK5176408.1 DUF333 domain-containing protein [Limnobaculum xujianqingii]
MKGKIGLAALGALLLAGCSSQPDQVRLLPHQSMITEEAARAAPMDEMALANCNSMGGMPTTSHNLDGSVVSKCQLSNGKRY